MPANLPSINSPTLRTSDDELWDTEVADTDRLQKQITVLFAERLYVEVRTAETDLLKEGILDSLQFVELLVQLERTFGVRLDLNALEFDDFRTIRKIAEFLARWLR